MKSSSERIQCVNGCGNLTHDSHDKLTVNQRIALVVGGIISILLWLRSLPVSDFEWAFYWFVGSVGAILVGIFGLGKAKDIPYFMCKVCKGGMLDSKSLIATTAKNSVLIIENALNESDFGEKTCPICEEKMKKISLKYSNTDHTFIIPIPYGNKNLELDACNDCSIIWFDSKEMTIMRAASSLKSDKKTSRSSNENQHVNFECSELDCKKQVMYKSKYCYTHRELSKES